MQERICVSCNESFCPSSRHKSCPKCRAKLLPKHPCVECGALIRTDRNKCIDCYSGPDEKNSNWKGGRTKHKSGYVMIRAKWHPRSKSNNGYVFEHILVMEEKIGRFLTSQETVHHKYGIKDDNNPDHLELWSGSHPSGCRVDDLVEFSIATLRKYSPELLTECSVLLYTDYLTLGPLSS